MYIAIPLVSEQSSETLLGVYKFEICDIYIWIYVKHNSSVGMY